MKGLIRNNIYSMQSNLLVSFLIALVLGVLPLFIQGDGILQMVISMQIYVFVANVAARCTRMSFPAGTGLRSRCRSAAARSFRLSTLPLSCCLHWGSGQGR